MKIIKSLSVVTVGLVMASCNNGGVTKKSLNTEIDSVSYAIGMDVARNVNTNVAEIDKDLFIQGFVNAVDSTDVLLEAEQVQGILSSYFQKKQADARKKQQEEAEKKALEEFGEKKIEGENFLAENKGKEGVQVTESGLQYIVLNEGDGEKPKATSRVKVHYHGTLIDGTVFDSSVDRGEPATFGVGQVIKGWTEGLQLMSQGAKYKFFIPQELAYGATPRPGGKIEPFAPLVFEVELIEVMN
ncbi:FKBP-type peptidyl-prolyl cis-trans isomerase [Gaetbulibacter saemankumensis]|uniref:FKBP-type peptidyl-prolyl cis-trans isomerase n=1 Tax=Gaetbulibacter saemankumensis TaxID=311208 RepID=UPI000420FFE5|nr:FKBP-type peptidyl-prolyl cis-trans isomerase [Gaetbulibacter saemankumensis]